MNLYRPKSEDIEWGNCLCSIRQCVNIAECVFEDLPYCLDCADALIDRQIAISLDPRMRQWLPNIGDR